MKVGICSGFAPQGYIQYGKRFLTTAAKYLPASVDLRVWTEEPVPMPRGECMSLWDITGATELRDKLSADPRYRGEVQIGRWKPTEKARGYSFKTDGNKFWKQLVIPEAMAGHMNDGDVLIWVDGDVEFLKPWPDDFIEKRVMNGCDLAYLARARGHPEIGWWAIRLNAKSRKFLHEIAEQYRSGRFEELPEWHSAFQWDHVRKSAGFREHNLSPGQVGHVWPNTILAPYTRHDKGLRKPGGTRG